MKVNNVRIYLRLITIADLANAQGTHICYGMVDGTWQSGSDLNWPKIPCPPRPHWALFWKCLRETFCKNTPIHQPARYSMELDEELGKWKAVPRHSWFGCYK